MNGGDAGWMFNQQAYLKSWVGDALAEIIAGCSYVDRDGPFLFFFHNILYLFIFSFSFFIFR